MSDSGSPSQHTIKILCQIWQEAAPSKGSGLLPCLMKVEFFVQKSRNARGKTSFSRMYMPEPRAGRAGLSQISLDDFTGGLDEQSAGPLAIVFRRARRRVLGHGHICPLEQLAAV